MQQVRVGPEGTLHHGVNVVQVIHIEEIVRQWIDRIDQLIEEWNWGTGVLRAHRMTGGAVVSIAHSMFWLLLCIPGLHYEISSWFIKEFGQDKCLVLEVPGLFGGLADKALGTVEKVRRFKWSAWQHPTDKLVSWHLNVAVVSW
jgi:hypothetical protein